MGFEKLLSMQQSTLKQIEKDLSLPNGFLYALVKEDDWSFIIKLHAFFESAIPRLLAKQLRRDDLIGAFSELDMSQKINFLTSLDLLQEHRAFLRRLSKMRNQFVHDVTKTKLSLKEYIARIDSITFQDFAKETSTPSSLKHPSFKKWCKEFPKEVIFAKAIYCINDLQLKRQEAQINLLFDNLYKKKGIETWSRLLK